MLVLSLERLQIPVTRIESKGANLPTRDTYSYENPRGYNPFLICPEAENKHFFLYILIQYNNPIPSVWLIFCTLTVLPLFKSIDNMHNVNSQNGNGYIFFQYSNLF